MMGMEMLLEGLGVDPKKLQDNVNNAVAHVAQINERIGKLENVITNERITNIEAALSIVLNHTTLTSATCLRIEDAVQKLRTDTPDNSTGFAALAAESFPDAAHTMQQQIEGGNDAGNDTDKQPKYVNGNGGTN